MTTETKERSEALGCAMLIALAAISVGIGSIFGAGYGWLAFGAILLALVVLA